MLTYSSLREIQKKELENGSLASLDENFYSEAFLLLKSKKEESKEGSTVAVREYENLKRIISTIRSKREEKILLMALRSEKSSSGLITQEKEIFDQVHDIINEYRGRAFSESDIKPAVQKIKMLKDLEQYKGADSNLYGPFKKGEILSIPKAEIEWLLKENIAEKI
ncbi:MAG: hypothetical protein PHU63_04785 [Candidatus ainarchaeum sp.]|nr:hypothetical protein [Candidatus ainarchaeum sp.]